MMKGRKLWVILGLAGILIGLGVPLIAEEVKLTTYYPAPFGDYKKLSAKKFKVDDGTWSYPANDGDMVVQGKVGIGTTEPEVPLEIGTTNPRLRFHDSDGRNWQIRSQNDLFQINDMDAGGAARVVIDTSGNVGIGTTSPDSKLDVNGGIKFKKYASTADAEAVDGNVVYTDDGFRYYDGAAAEWKPLGGGGIKSIQWGYGSKNNSGVTVINHAPVDVSKSFIILNGGAWMSDANASADIYITERTSNNFKIKPVPTGWASYSYYYTWQLIEFE